MSDKKLIELEKKPIKKESHVKKPIASVKPKLVITHELREFQKKNKSIINRAKLDVAFEQIILRIEAVEKLPV